MQQIQHDESQHRLTKQEAPNLYEALGYAILAALLLVGAIVAMTELKPLVIGLGIFALFLGSVTLGIRAILKHHEAQDKKRKAEEEAYQRRLENLIKQKKGATKAPDQDSDIISTPDE